MTVKTLAMFPGQGSQYVGMGKELLEQFPYCRELFEEAEDAISVGIRKLCLEGPESDLTLTANTQPAILTVSSASWKVLKEECGFEAEFVAGHSLGEFSALVAAGRLNFADAIRLVRKRGEAMQKAVPVGKGGMAAVMRVEADELRKKCLEVSTPRASVQIANYNNPQQLVTAGHAEAIDRLLERLKSEKKKAVKLNVSAPFHSKLMGPAKKVMAKPIHATPLAQSPVKIFPNLTAEPVEDYKPEFLVDQIDHPVLWMQTIENAQEIGVSRFVEVGPSTVLTGLLRRSPMRDGSAYMNTDLMRDAVKKIQEGFLN